MLQFVTRRLVYRTVERGHESVRPRLVFGRNLSVTRVQEYQSHTDKRERQFACKRLVSPNENTSLRYADSC